MKYFFLPNDKKSCYNSSRTRRDRRKDKLVVRMEHVWLVSKSIYNILQYKCNRSYRDRKEGKSALVSLVVEWQLNGKRI